MKLFTKKISKLNYLIILTLSFLATSQAMAFGCDNSFSPAIGSGTGDGASAATPIIIDSPAGLAALATCTNAGNTTSGFYYQLAGNIDLSGYTNWTPIGDYNIPSATFNGTFDGNNHTINGLTITSGGNYQGLFGDITSNATVSNINLTNVNISTSSASWNYVGSLVGSIDRSTINNVVVESGSVITGDSAFIGGIVGNAINSSIIINCSNSATVTGGINSSVGGIIGATTNNGSITNSSNSGAINAGDSSQVGGIAGQVNINSLVTTSYNTGSVGSSTLTNGYVGGLVGYFAVTISRMNQSYNVGSVSAGTGSNVGALYGGDDGVATPTIADVYFDNSKSGAGSTVGIGLTTADMSQNASATTMPGFDFATTWMTFTDDVYHYPQLRALYNGTSVQKAYSLVTTRTNLVAPVAIPTPIPSSGLLALLALIGLLVVGSSYRFRRK